MNIKSKYVVLTTLISNLLFSFKVVFAHQNCRKCLNQLQIHNSDAVLHESKCSPIPTNYPFIEPPQGANSVLYTNPLFKLTDLLSQKIFPFPTTFQITNLTAATFKFKNVYVYIILTNNVYVYIVVSTFSSSLYLTEF